MPKQAAWQLWIIHGHTICKKINNVSSYSLLYFSFFWYCWEKSPVQAMHQFCC